MSMKMKLAGVALATTFGLSGATALSLPVFVLASVLARGLRFFVVAALLWRFGAPIRDFIERRLGVMFTLFMALLVGGFVLVRYL